MPEHGITALRGRGSDSRFGCSESDVLIPGAMLPLTRSTVAGREHQEEVAAEACAPPCSEACVPTCLSASVPECLSASVPAGLRACGSGGPAGRVGVRGFARPCRHTRIVMCL